MYLCSEESRNSRWTFWFPQEHISNEYLFHILSKRLRITQSYLLKKLYGLGSRSNFLKKLLIANPDCSLENRRLLNDKECVIQLPKSDVRIAHHFLTNFGWKSGQKIVLLCIRDNHFQLSRDPKSKVQNFRNSSIFDFIPTIEYLCANSFFVIRMGKSSYEKLPAISENLIDYPFLEGKSDLLDITLFYLADFVVTTGTGLDQVGEMFRKPILRVNYLPIGDIMTKNRNYRVLPKQIVDKDTRQVLNLQEIVSHGLFLANDDETYEKAGKIIVSNSPLIILEEVKVFVEDIKESVGPNSILQNDFNTYMMSYSGFKIEDVPILSSLWQRNKN